MNGSKLAHAIALSVLIVAAPFGAVHAQERPFGTLRDQTDVRQEWLAQRLERVLPRLMREQGVDM
jgi:hypothetical protein